MGLRNREPVGNPILLSTTVRGKRFVVYMPKGGGTITGMEQDQNAPPTVNGVRATEQEVVRGWMIAKAGV